MEHWELVQEMPHVEQMSTQERLQLARRRRGHQLKIWTQKEKEYLRRPANKAHKSNKRHIFFNDSVVLLEAAARNDIDEVIRATESLKEEKRRETQQISTKNSMTPAVRRLLMKGVSPDSCNEDGLTALHQCCIDDNEAMLQLLLEYGANVNAEDSEKWTPLHAAATCGHLRLVKCLIGRGANLLAVNADGNMPYDICEDESTLDYIESEMAHRGVTQQLIDETRAHTEMQMLTDLQRIAAQNGDLEVYDHQGATPLHIAAANGYISVVEFLLDHHVSTDVKDRDEWQPAHAAACWGHLEVLELLVHSGADLNAKNKHDETPADICEDPELRERIIQLKSEQESKRQAEAQRKRVRRSQSNTRAQSVRRTSLRDKTLTTKKDAVEEARLRLQAQEGYENPDSVPAPEAQINNSNNNNNNDAQSSVQPVTMGPGNPEYDKMALANTENRKAPEGKDNDSLMDTSESKDGQKESTYTTDANGKINVTVFVTINGTLADLKKQRAQIRNSSTELNSITTPISSLPESDSGLSTSPLSVHRFSGNTGDVVGDTRSKRCCVIQ